MLAPAQVVSTMAGYIYLLSCLLVLVSSHDIRPMVKIPHGWLRGSWKESTDGRLFASFEGIPYAAPPVGFLRFRVPQVLEAWPGVWDATKPLSECLQYEPFLRNIIGSEDCLFVNVHTPDFDVDASLPVVVFIHGGAFMYGSGSLYFGENIMDRDVVVVTLNYRLGPLGFLSTGDDASPGNIGLKDQVFALKWVKNNIKFFGGNPESVTLTGCSAGGASVHYHYLSPMSKGLFHRGMAFSGSALASWTHSVRATSKAKALASVVGCPTEDSRVMVDCLRYRPAEVIVGSQLRMFGWDVNMFTMFTPTIEPEGIAGEAFLTEYPYHATEAGAMQRVPLIASVTSEEGLYPAAAYQVNPNTLLDLESNWEELAPIIFEYNDTLPLAKRSRVANKIKQEYLGGRPVSQETFPELVQALGDRLFVESVGKMAQLHALKSGQPTYFYRYSYRATRSFSNLMAKNKNNYGVCHADDVIFIFKYFFYNDESPEDLKMKDVLLDMVYSYASTGVPKFRNGLVWEKVKPGSKNLDYLDIVSPSKIGMKSSSDLGKKSFWDSLGFLEYQDYVVNNKRDL